MKFRKATSLTALTSFAVLTLTSVVLYIVPHGRVAYWADWRLWGLTKEQWGDVHLNVGVLFLVAVGLHLWLNWGPVMSYLKNRAKRFTFFTGECNLALAVCALFVAGTLAGVPPFSWITGLGTYFKDEASRTYGEPPYGHAELSTIKALARNTGLDLDAALAGLAAAGVEGARPEAVVGEVAGANAMSPDQVWKAMGGGKPPEPVQGGLPETAPLGTGRMTVAELCTAYGLDQAMVLETLAAAGMRAEAEMTLKAVAETAGVHPERVYEVIRGD